ncbi:MarR family winged helix-turn-helix transcriptional regulator [Ferrimonas pelagia]|uniref:HTH marR-type domain-containing protein n=1 Tax=Ferrimonas pelagia TaxID=1177826 RepID=A0ABP9FDU4_9GAMM
MNVENYLYELDYAIWEYWSHLTGVSQTNPLNILQYKLVRVLEHQGAISLQDLGRQFDLTNEAVVDWLDALTRDGFIDIQHGVASITPAGARAVRQDRVVYRQIVREMSGRLAPNEQRQLTGLLKKMLG